MALFEGRRLTLSQGHLGVQASLPADLVPLGATTFLFVISASCAIFLAIGEAIFQNRLGKGLADVVSPALAEKIISVGATSIRSAVPKEELPTVVSAYSTAVTQVFVRLPILYHGPARLVPSVPWG